MYLYFGDDDATRAAAYLCGVMTHEEIPYVRVNSSETPPDSFGTTLYDVYILSDYPRVHFSAAHL
ncbi:MAG: hypothetical protein LBQ54_13790, partial [Planctomycetaceae bacterium]|nr:hypothetical protein [Planctomycetaceae bacterium]